MTEKRTKTLQDEQLGKVSGGQRPGPQPSPIPCDDFSRGTPDSETCACAQRGTHYLCKDCKYNHE